MFRFANEENLWLLLLLIPLAGAMLWSRHRRSVRMRRLGAYESVARLMPYASRWRFWLRGGLLLVAIASLIVGLARPQFGERVEREKRKGCEILFVLDISQSMMAEDVKPNRLSRAKLEISQMLNHLRNDRVGLILFAGKSYVQLPITNDYASAQMFLSQVSCDMISEQGTRLADAIGLATNSFSPNTQAGKAIVVISDGENHEDDPVGAAQRAHSAGIRIHTVGIGSPDGAPIPDARQGLKKDSQGTVVISRLDERVLTQVALATGGIYLRANSYLGGLEPVVRALDELEKAEFDQVIYASHNEQYQLFLLLSLLSLALSTLVLERRNPWFSVERLFESIRRM